MVLLMGASLTLEELPVAHVVSSSAARVSEKAHGSGRTTPRRHSTGFRLA